MVVDGHGGGGCGVGEKCCWVCARWRPSAVIISNLKSFFHPGTVNYR